MNRNAKIQMIFFGIVAGLLVLSMRTPAGLLNPTSPPGSTMHTLDEVFTQGIKNQISLPVPTIPRKTVLYLQVPGAPGESKDPAHLTWIDAIAYQWGTTRPSRTFPTGTGGSASLADLVVVSPVDTATPKLFLACCQGTHFPTVTLESWNTATPPVAIFKFLLTDAMITSVKPVSNNSYSGQEFMMEEVSFDYSKIELDYTPVDSAGNPGDIIRAQWDQLAGISG
jgi:type VI secretion system secreted protein Hcp